MIDILFEDGEALVIDKPAGLSIDRPRGGGPALEDHVDSLKMGFMRRPLAVHRLDTDTSGCLLLARNPKAHKRFTQAFQDRLVAKRYLGILNGSVADDDGTIDIALTKISSKEEGWRMVGAPNGKPSVTHWRKVEEKDGKTLIEFRPETGRTHQIRIHALEGLGAPLMGDPVYGKGHALGAGRTMLHASAIEVQREGKPPVQATAPYPKDFGLLGFTDD